MTAKFEYKPEKQEDLNLQFAFVVTLLCFAFLGLIWWVTNNNYTNESNQVEKCNTLKERGFNTQLRIWGPNIFGEKYHLCSIEIKSLGFVQNELACKKMGIQNSCIGD